MHGQAGILHKNVPFVSSVQHPTPVPMTLECSGRDYGSLGDRGALPRL